MEVFLEDARCGQQHAVYVGENDMPHRLQEEALDVVFGSPADTLAEDVVLWLAGKAIDDSAPLCATGVTQGCSIAVSLSGARFVEALSAKEQPAVPSWAWKLREVALAAVRRSPAALNQVSEALRKDRRFVLAAVWNNWTSIKYVDFRGDEAIMLRVVQLYPCGDDREVGMAVRVRGCRFDFLHHATACLQRYGEVVLAALAEDTPRDASIYGDRAAVEECVQRSPNLAGVSEALRADRDLVLDAVRVGWGFHHAPESLRRDTGFWREVVLWNGGALGEDAPLSLRSDRDLVLAALETDPAALEHAAPCLRADREMVLAALRSHGLWCIFVPPPVPHALLLDPEVVLAYVRREPGMLSRADVSLRSNRDFVMKCIEVQGCALEGVGTAMRDAEMQLAAVAQDPCALKYTDDSIRSDREVVLAAVRQNGSALMYASRALRNDRAVVLAAVQSEGGALEYADTRFRSDEEVVLAALHGTGCALRFADLELVDNRAFMLAAVHKAGCSLHYASPLLCRDAELQREAVLQDGRALQYADLSLRKDRSVVLAAVRTHGGALELVAPVFRRDEEIVLTAVTSHGMALRFAHTPLRGKRDVVLAAVSQDGFALQHAHRALCSDKEVALAAVRADPAAFTCVAAPLRRDSDVVAAAFPESNSGTS